MKRASALLAVTSAFALLAAPVLVLAMGSGGGGGGGMPSGGGGMMNQPSMGPEYDPQVEYQRGSDALQAGKYRDAVTDFTHVTDVAPRSASGWLMLGEAKEGAGDEKGAQKAYERSVKLDGTSVPAHRALALAEIKLNQMDKARAELADLQTKAATCGDSCADAADLKAAIGAIQAGMPGAAPAPAAANEAATHLSVAAPQAGDGAYVRAVSLINERRWDDALASLDKAETALGPHPDILTYKGYVWRKKGDWTRAEDFYRQALAIDPTHRGATEYFGELKVLKGDVAGAKSMLARLDAVCTYGCAEAVELRRWIDHGGDPAA